MGRLDFIVDAYNPVEATIHMARYMNARPYVKGKRVLDVACGEGYGSALMKRWGATSVVGVDISGEAVDIANSAFATEGLEYIQHDAEQLPFDDVSFDMAVSLETIEHLDHPEKFLRELRRVVRAGGTIVVSCPNDQYYADNVENFSNPYHKRRYTFYDFREMAEKAFGETGAWYMGSALAGFVNMPLSNCHYPEKGDPEAPENMLAMLEAKKIPEALEVPASKYINSWNCVYYVGVWGDTRTWENLSNACLYPVPHFFLYQNREVPDSAKYAKELLKAYEALEKKSREEHQALTEAQEQLQDKFDTLKEEHRVLTNERDRLYLLNDMQKKVEQLHWNQLYDLRTRNEQLYQEHLEYFGLKEAYAKQQQEASELRAQNKQLFQEHLEYFGLKEAYTKQQQQLAETEALYQTQVNNLTDQSRSQASELREVNETLCQQQNYIADLKGLITAQEEAYAKQQQQLAEETKDHARKLAETEALYQTQVNNLTNLNQGQASELREVKEALRQQQNYIADLKGFIAAQEEAKHQLEEMIQKMQNTKGWRALEKVRRFVRGIH